MIVRDATRADAAQIAGVHIRAWQSAYRGLLPDAHLDGLSVQERERRYTLGSQDPDAPATILAVDGARVCGFASFGGSRDDDARGLGELYALYVEPSRWGEGIGRLLLARAIERLCERGHQEAILWVLRGNTKAQRFYRADGWRRDGARRYEDVYGVGANVIRYRRRIA